MPHHKTFVVKRKPETKTKVEFDPRAHLKELEVEQERRHPELYRGFNWDTRAEDAARLGLDYNRACFNIERRDSWSVVLQLRAARGIYDRTDYICALFREMWRLTDICERRGRSGRNFVRTQRKSRKLFSPNAIRRHPAPRGV